jgi:hypothetical protein
MCYGTYLLFFSQKAFVLLTSGGFIAEHGKGMLKQKLETILFGGKYTLWHLRVPNFRK